MSIVVYKFQDIYPVGVLKYNDGDNEVQVIMTLRDIRKMTRRKDYELAKIMKSYEIPLFDNEILPITIRTERQWRYKNIHAKDAVKLLELMGWKRMSMRLEDFIKEHQPRLKIRLVKSSLPIESSTFAEEEREKEETTPLSMLFEGINVYYQRYNIHDQLECLKGLTQEFTEFHEAWMARQAQKNELDHYIHLFEENPYFNPLVEKYTTNKKRRKI